MRSLITISLSLILIVCLSWCTNNQEVEQLKIQNAVLQEKLNQTVPVEENTGLINKPNIVTVTISWLWWALSRQTSVIGEQRFFITDPFYTAWYESLPINSEEGAKDFVEYRFNWWWYALIATCNEWYAMTKCEPFSKTDSVENQWTQCFLWNEDPNLMRTSMIIECSKM